MMSPVAPALSVVLPTDTWETIRTVVERLRRQTVATAIEVVLVVPSEGDAGLDRMDRGGFARVVVVAHGSIAPLAGARAAGVRAATAPLVFIGETHSYPHRGWAAAVLAAAERGPYAAIVPAFGNANPGGALSWAAFFSDYGAWVEGRPAGEIEDIPTFNSVYRRSTLLELGDRLELALAHGDELNVYLRTRGHRAIFEPAARLDHVNIAQPAAWLWERLICGWMIGGNRGRRWTWMRRIAYAGAWPAIAVVLAARILPIPRPAADGRRAPVGTSLLMVAGTWLKAIGEAIGYLLGPSERVEIAADELEVHRLAYVRRGSE